MVSLNDVLLAMSNIPVDDPIAEIWGRGLQGGGHTVIEYTGTLPITINAKCNALLDYKIYGNTVQNGTPTPENPVDVVGCGERTENLFDFNANNPDNGYVYGKQLTSDGSIDTFPQTNISEYISITPFGSYTFSYGSQYNEVYVALYNAKREFIRSIKYNGRRVITFYSQEDETYLRITYLRANKEAVYVVEGSIPPESYEPYGYKLPMGSRTENLFNPNGVTTNERGEVKTGVELPAGKYCVTNVSNSPCYWRQGVETTTSNLINPSLHYVYINASDTLVVWVNGYSNKKIMLNEGSTPSPYEPYRRTVTNIYLGEVETTRRVKKLVLTGEETSYMTIDASKNIFSIRGVFNQAPELLQVGGFCSHYKYNNAISSLAQNMSNGDFVLNKIADDYSFTIMDNSFSNGTDFNRYVQQQYAAGTPVTVWYVLAEPETGIVNEPLMKIGDYADTVSMEQAGASIPTFVGTTVIDYDGAPKPSQMYIKYRR